MPVEKRRSIDHVYNRFRGVVVGGADVRSEYADAAGLAGMVRIKRQRQAGLDQQALRISSRKERAAWAIVYSSNMQRATHTGVR